MDGYIEVKEALYGHGLHPHIRMSEVRTKVGPLKRSKSRYSPFTYSYLRIEDVERAKQQIRESLVKRWSILSIHV